MEPESPHRATQAQPEAPAEETLRDRSRRHVRRAALYTWTGILVLLLVVVIALVAANTRSVKVSWVFGSTHQSLVWIILVTAILGWLAGIVTSVVIRFRTRAVSSDRRHRARGAG
jgi:uncharacterized integral membrane protein